MLQNNNNYNYEVLISHIKQDMSQQGINFTNKARLLSLLASKASQEILQIQKKNQ